MTEQLPRTINRALWKAIWRQIRIANRESLKAIEDCVLYGTGMCVIGEGIPDFIQHVSLE